MYIFVQLLQIAQLKPVPFFCLVCPKKELKRRRRRKKRIKRRLFLLNGSANLIYNDNEEVD